MSRTGAARTAAVVVLVGGALALAFAGPHAPPTPRTAPRADAPLASPGEGTPATTVDAAHGGACVACHRERHPGVVAQHLASRHARQDVGCADCHGDDHERIFREKGRVPASRCGDCHPRETAEFLRSPHADATRQALGAARLTMQIPAMQRRGCLACHSQGLLEPGTTETPDEARCTACHGGHRFSSADARQPESCGLCHRGPDHPHVEAWEASPHGVAWRASHGDERQAPTCSTCHMPGGSHDVGRGITLGTSGSGAVLEGEPAPIPMRTLTREAQAKERAAMLAVCTRCHTERAARGALDDADAIKRECDRLVGLGAELVRRLGTDHLLDPDPGERPPHPTAGHALVLGGAMLFENQSEAERLFFDVAKFAHAITFKAAYHQSPDWTHWLGIARLKSGLEALKAEDRRLRGGR